MYHLLREMLFQFFQPYTVSVHSEIILSVTLVFIACTVCRIYELWSLQSFNAEQEKKNENWSKLRTIHYDT